MPELLGVTNPVPGHDNANVNRNLPNIPNDPLSCWLSQP